MISPMQRSLLGLTVLLITSLMVFLISKSLTLETHRRDGLLHNMIANVSGNLDRLESGLDNIHERTVVARNRLRQLIALHRESLLVCAMLSEKRQSRTSGKRPPMRQRRRRSAVT